MNCDALAEIILDVARAAPVPEAARLSVRRHMETCPSCAAECARQRDLTTALQGLAAEAQEWKAPAAMEQRLLAAFTARHEREVPAGTRTTTGRWGYALATAAVLTLAVWGLRETGEPANRGTGESENRQTGEPVNRGTGESENRQTGEPVNRGTGESENRQTGEPANRRTGESENRRTGELAGKAAAAGSAEGSATRAPIVETARPPAPTVLAPSTVRTANARPADPRAASSVEFVRIPGAIGLPELESGTVLRMELPLTALPEYGLDIAPDAMRSSVEADVLVGQDGQPRAIRLVGIPDGVAQDSRSRQ